METWKCFANLLGKKYTFFVAIIANLLGFFSGMSIAWSSPVLAKLNGTDDNPLGYPITKEQYSLIGSVFSIGGAAGPILLIYALELLGRKFTMIIIATIIPVVHFVLAFSETIALYYVCRIAIGIAVSGTFSIVAVYLCEIASAKMRGTYVSLGTSFILTGCLFSYSIGPFVSIRNFNLIIAVSSTLYVPLFMLSCPESLYYTMQKKGPQKTLEILRTLRTNSKEEDELREIETSVKNEGQGTFLDIFKTKASTKAFIICTLLLIFQQLCGVNDIIIYGQNIFADAKISIAPEICTIIVSSVQTASCLITPIASKRFNRKLLLSLSFAGVSFSNCLLGLYYCVDFVQQYEWVPLFSLISFVIFYNCGVGPLPWVTLGELYPLNVRSSGTALSNTIYWIVQFLLTFYFPQMDPAISFLTFSAVCLFTIIFIKFFLIETRGKTLQEIQRSLEQ